MCLQLCNVLIRHSHQYVHIVPAKLHHVGKTENKEKSGKKTKKTEKMEKRKERKERKQTGKTEKTAVRETIND